MPAGLRIAATIVSVSITSLTGRRYHITSDVSRPPNATGVSMPHQMYFQVPVGYPTWDRAE